jgi:hypothetical protein
MFLTIHRYRLARSIGPNRVGSRDDEGRAIPRNVVIAKHRDDGLKSKEKIAVRHL